MKKLLITLGILLAAVPAVKAQIVGDGYYRVQNATTKRYVSMIDNKGSVDLISQRADLEALVTLKNWDDVESNPGTILYCTQVGDAYNLASQGSDTYSIIKYNLNVRDNNDGTYTPYGQKDGVRLYLNDSYDDEDIGYMGTNGKDTRKWYIKPFAANGDNYFGLKPQLKAKDGNYYQTFYAAFPFSFVNKDMKAYTVSKVSYGMAVLSEVSGNVPAATPVIVKAASQLATQNRLNLLVSQDAAPATNLLRGVYFCNDVRGTHRNVVENDVNTMRVLSTAADGSLVFAKGTEKYIAANTAYLTVPEGTPDVLRVVTQEEYDAMTIDPIVVRAKSYTVEYGDPLPTLEYEVEGSNPRGGQPVLACQAKAGSPVGTYEITVDASSLQNIEVKTVAGTLTITKAPLTISAGTYTKKQGEAVPQLALTYSGFKNGETEAVLTKKPTATCEVTAESAPGEYVVTVAGAEAENYAISYNNGKVIVTEADPVTITANSYTREYGEANPAFAFTAAGATLEGTPEIVCEATPASPVGTYPILVRQGSVKNYNVAYVAGTLTVTKAPLTISAGVYTKKQGEAMPELTPDYSGFKNDETEAVLTTKPTVGCEATADSAPGEYEITVSGAEAENYAISYVNGKLIVTEPDAIVITAKSYEREYGEENPVFEFTTEGAELDGKPELVCEATATSAVGTYAITLVEGSVKNFKVVFVPGTLTITKAPLTITANDCTFEQDTELPEFTATYAGFKNNETEDVLTVKPVFTTVATAQSEPGTYEIVASGAEAENYSITYVSGTLTVTASSGIAGLMAQKKSFNVYDMQGRLVRRNVRSLQGLPQGLYIVNGMKVVVR